MEKENMVQERQKKRDAYVTRGLNPNTLSTETSEEEDDEEEESSDKEVASERVHSIDDNDSNGDGGPTVMLNIGAPFAPVTIG